MIFEEFTTEIKSSSYSTTSKDFSTPPPAVKVVRKFYCLLCIALGFFSFWTDCGIGSIGQIKSTSTKAKQIINYGIVTRETTLRMTLLLFQNWRVYILWSPSNQISGGDLSLGRLVPKFSLLSFQFDFIYLLRSSARHIFYSSLIFFFFYSLFPNIFFPFSIVHTAIHIVFWRRRPPCISCRWRL